MGSIMDRIKANGGAAEVSQPLSDEAIDDLYREKEARRMERVKAEAEAEGLTVPEIPYPVRMVIELVTPKIAEAYLLSMILNRKPSKTKENFLVQDMNSGRFYVINQGIGFNTDEKLMDGQHRLDAIIKSGLPQWLPVFRGILPEAIAAIDRTNTRDLGDQLTMDGLVYGRLIARSSHMILNTLHAWVRDLSWSGLGTPAKTDTEMRDEYVPTILALINPDDRNAAATEWMSYARKLSDKGMGAIGINDRAAATFYWVARYSGYREEVERFIEEVYIGGVSVHPSAKNLRARVEQLHRDAEIHKQGVAPGLYLVHLLKGFTKYLKNDSTRWAITNDLVPTLPKKKK